MRLLIIVLFLLSAICMKAQLSIFNLSLTDTLQNIFYIGVDNTIKISGQQYDPVKHHTVITPTGNLITNEQKELLKKLSPGDLIVFERIYCVGPDNRRRLLTPIVINIK